MTDPHVDLFVDLSTQDDTGLPWTFIADAVDPSIIVPGRYVIGGAGMAVAVVQVLDIGSDGVVHVRPMSGSVEENRHLLDAQPSSA